MQIVIEIPESLYNAINQDIYINGMRSGKTILQKLVNAIANGTVLPEHGRLIDVDVRIKRLKEIKSMVEISNAMADGPQQTKIEKRVKVLAEAIQILKEAPTILEATK